MKISFFFVFINSKLRNFIQLFLPKITISYYFMSDFRFQPKQCYHRKVAFGMVAVLMFQLNKNLKDANV